ncbi:2-oxoacid:acceptor oxidoreductase family protein [Clostridium sp. PL3]|uniref:2-oxoacid:acceptor oxidoreductase family protein n=1 Tax=Clostridium thailandense TaxID=2794346 RepID=A0A949TVL8_9CLOT|nr:2-oxoacid:acceptor oxidoreductase family protein [Clostridium thailandense]MBV7274346.1 2-oxoacid:acceptor oxidoreductase family protein [Clostridium thailandense]
MNEIIFAGFGGQGVLTVGLIISQIAVSKGNNATWMPSYGSAMRGGTANCTVKYGKEFIYNPSQEEADILLAMNIPSFMKFIDAVKLNGIVVINSDTVTCDVHVREDLRIIKIPCSSMAKEIGNEKGANIIMAGIIARLLKEFTEDESMECMNDMFRKKGKSKFEAKNMEAFKLGFRYVDGGCNENTCN